jgi:flagellar biosynthetic protein FliQ
VTYELVVELARQSVITAFLITAPLLTVALAVGLLVSIVQTVTQIQEQTVQFTLKLFATGVVLFLLLPWMLSVSVGFGVGLIRAIPVLVF